MQSIVYVSAVLRCDVKTAFAMFTINDKLQSWLTNAADVEPRVGGKYELFWDPNDRENNSTIGCKITLIEENKVIAFDWKGPPQFKDFMNTAEPLTHVVVFFIPCGDAGAGVCTEVHLMHTGWREAPEWQKAKSYFDTAWAIAFKNLEGLCVEP